MTFKQRKYLGGEALKKKIEFFHRTSEVRNTDYDCILGLSGGRDSSYLLYYLVKLLGLKVLAFSVDHGLIPDQTKVNMKNMAKILNVKLVIQEHDYLIKCIKHHISSWMRRPSPAMIGMLCVGCRLGMTTGIVKLAKATNIPVIMVGGMPFENGFKYALMKITPNGKKYYSFILGYLLRLMRNPKWVLNWTCLITQIKEYYHHYYRRMYRKNLLIIEPFIHYIRWKEDEIVSTIERELGWNKNPNVETTWRGDCDIALLKSYLYKKTLGFNDHDYTLSCLVRAGDISREEALERLNNAEIPAKVAKELLDKFGFQLSI